MASSNDFNKSEDKQQLAETTMDDEPKIEQKEELVTVELQKPEFNRANAILRRH